MPARRIAATTAAAAGRPITGRMDWAGPQPAAPRRATDWDADKSILVVFYLKFVGFRLVVNRKGCEWQTAAVRQRPRAANFATVRHTRP